jgi:transposase
MVGYCAPEQRLQRVACPLSAWETRSMKRYSKDLRLRVLAAVDRGMARKEVAETFGVSEPTIGRYLKLRRETGGVDPKPPSGPPARKGQALEAALPSQVSRNPNLTLEEHRELFYDEHGTEVSTATVRRPQEARAAAQKQSLPASDRDEAERARWHEWVRRLDPGPWWRRGAARWSTCRRIRRTSRPSRRPSASSRCSFGRPRPGHAWRSWRPSAERSRRSPRGTPRATSAARGETVRKAS